MNRSRIVILSGLVLSAVVLVEATGAMLWAQEKPGSVTEAKRTTRVAELTKERDRIRRELHELRKQPEGVTRSTAPRSELSDQPTRSMKESLKSLPGVSVRQNQSGRDVQLSIRGSK